MSRVSEQSWVASVVEMVTPESFAKTAGRENFSIYRRACRAAVRLTPIPLIAVYGDGSDQARLETVTLRWLELAVATRDEFGRRVADLMKPAAERLAKE